MTTSYSLHLTQTPQGPPGTPGAVLAQLITHDPQVMAATLRAAADRLDPPQPPRPVYRRGDHLRAAVERGGFTVEGRTGTRDRTCNQPGHAATGCNCGTLRTVTRDAIERAARRPTATLADEPDPAALSTTGNAYDASCQGNACNEGHTYLAGCALASGEPLARQITAKPHGAWACRMGGQPHAGTCDEPRPLDTPPQACPRIAHESGVVIACRVEHAVDHTGRRKFDGALHGNNEHMAIWADDDERIIDRE